MDIKRVMDDFLKTKIAVIGDVMLDRTIYGKKRGKTSEADGFIVDVIREGYCLGGAANTAANDIIRASYLSLIRFG